MTLAIKKRNDYLLIELLKNNILMLKDANFINSSRDIDKMPQIITNDLSCQIWSIMYQYIYLCSNIDPNDNNLEKIINVNPFYYMMMFLTNIYDFYKSKDKNILEGTRYDYDIINDFKYFDLRRQFLHLIENKCDSKFMKISLFNKQLNKFIENNQSTLKYYSDRYDNSTESSRTKEALMHEIYNLERTISILEDIK